MPLVAVRGATKIIDEVELQAYLASILRLENVGLLLGAGASVPAGGQTMQQVWNNFVEKSPTDAQWLKDSDFIDAAALVDGDSRTSPNVEELIDSIEIALIESTRQNSSSVKDILRVRASLARSIVSAALLDQSWWNVSEGADSDADKLSHHRTILQKIVAARQPGQASPWVFTTNYDLAIEWAAESIDLQIINGFLGVHSRRFSPQSFDLGFRNTQARGEARFGIYNIYLAKLHGSLSWREEDGQVFELPAQLAWQQINKFLQDETQTELGLMVLPRAAKYLQTVGYVLGELLRRFAEFMSRPQTSLIISGYGFGDEHINRLLRSALLNPTLQLVIYYPEFGGDPQTNKLPKALNKLLALNNPRVIVIGGGSSAFIDKLATQLPEPILYDEEMRKLEKAIRKEDDAADIGIALL